MKKTLTKADIVERTDEAITLPPRKVVVFRLSRKFRAELNS